MRKVLIIDESISTLQRLVAAAAACPMMTEGGASPMDEQGNCSKMGENGICEMLAAACTQKKRMVAAEDEVLDPINIRFTAAGTEGGYKWRVQIIEAGPDKQGNIIYPLSVLKAAAPLYEGARVFALTEGQHTAGKNPYGKSVRDIVGYISDVAVNATGLEGTVNILSSAQWLRDMLVDSWNAGKTDLVALSHDVMGKTVMKGSAREATQIVKVDSVDVVYDPIGGGKFLRMAAAAKAGQTEDNMNWTRLLAALKAMRPSLASQIDALLGKGDAVTEAEISQLVAAALAQDNSGIDQLLAALKTDNSALDAATKVLDEARLVACGTKLDASLASCGLPITAVERLRASFNGKVFDDATLAAAITGEKEYLDKLAAAGLITGAGGVRTDIQTEPERLQAAMDKLFGVDVADTLKDVPAFESLRAAYTRITGDTQVRGQVDKDHAALNMGLAQMMRLPAAYSTSSFTYVLGNSMYRRLVNEYRAVDYREDALVSYYRNAVDFKIMEIINIGYFGDLPDVNPETGDFEEITMPTDLESTYSLNQKGIIISVTRRTMINDDLKSLAQLISKLGRAARRTYAKRVWGKVLNNATFKGDGKALFHNDHANLSSTALTNDATGIATLTAILQAMYNQTEQDSGEGLGLEALYLWVPRTLREVAMGLNSPWPTVAGGNPHAGRFGANHERIITTPLFTDVTDYGIIADKNAVEMLEVAFLNGQREPELFVADNPAVGQMFMSDKLQYKQRHEYEVEIADTKGLHKAVVAGS